MTELHGQSKLREDIANLMLQRVNGKQVTWIEAAIAAVGASAIFIGKLEPEIRADVVTQIVAYLPKVVGRRASELERMRAISACKPRCLHCVIMDLILSRRSVGHTEGTAALAELIEAMADVISRAPAPHAETLLTEAKKLLPEREVAIRAQHAIEGLGKTRH